MAYHIDNKNLPKCNAAPQTPSLELEMLKNRYENAIKKAEEAKQLFEQKALGLDNNLQSIIDILGYTINEIDKL